MEDCNMKRTYLKPQSTDIAASGNLIDNPVSWAAGKYDQELVAPAARPLAGLSQQSLFCRAI